jgi:enoyl-CoA hydratase/carnithine racemase
VDLRGGVEGLSDEALGELMQTLTQLPCPSVALGAGGDTRAGQALAARFDVVVDGEPELEALAEQFARHPQASLAAVQLLRQGERLDLHEALIAESLVYSTLQSGPEFGAWLASHKRRERPAPAGPAVLVDRCGDQLVLTLNRPEKRNAYSAEMRDALVEGLAVAVSDPTLQVVLRGEGPAFCAGGDLDEFGTLPDPATAHVIRSTRNAARMLARIAPRVRAELHGACVGAGIELPAFAGRVVARRDAFFQLPELSMGLVPGAGGTASLPRRIGRQRTAWLTLSGRRVDAPTARAWGLVDEVVAR